MTEKETIIQCVVKPPALAVGSVNEKLISAQDDMDAHSYNSYRDDDEYSILFTVKEIQWLKDEPV